MIIDHKPHLGRSGVTLVELMVSVVILSVGILGLVATFGGIQRAVQTAKNKTLASTLAQEKMQILKQKNYYQVLITPDPPAQQTDFSPSIPFDSVYFSSETILQGSVYFQRLTYVQVAKENSGVIELLPAGTPDTGLKLITVTTIWTQGGEKKKQTLTSVLSNPNTVTANAIFTGTVKNAETNALINGALVNAAENMGWRDTANVSGVYSIGLSPGNFTLVASAPGYFRKFVAVTAEANVTTTQDFLLVPMSSGTVTGTAWYNPDLVISQVVAATNTICGDGALHDVEYITLFNPTTAAIDIGATGLSSGKSVNVAYVDENSTFDRTDTQFNLTHVSTFVPPHAGYLIANATYFFLAGGWRTADAYYKPTVPDGFACANALYCDVIRNDRAGGIELTNAADGHDIDTVGWDDVNNSAPTHEDTPVDLSSVDGLATGSQIVRISSPTDAPTATQLQEYGPAYDSGDNADDFSFRPTVDVEPLCVSTAMPIIAGVPAIGAIISVNDGLSDPTTAYRVGAPVTTAEFVLTNVATGTWMVFLSKDGYGLENDTVTIVASGSVYTFPSSTTFLSSAVTQGFISGQVTDVAGAPISPAITVSPGSAGADQTAAVANGRYFLRVSTGSVGVTANPGSANVDYMSQSLSVAVDAGEVVNDLDFILSQGGRITGFITRDGVNALPGIAIAALDGAGYSRDQQVSDISGYFTTVNVPTGTYTVTPALDSIETSAPASQAVTVAVGATVDAGTFTITGSMGAITGTVKVGGKPVSSGVLIVAAPGTLSGSPPAMVALSSATLTGSPYYLVSSQEDGTYSLSVRGGSYLLYGYYNTVSKSGAVTISAQDLGSVTVTPGVTVPGKDFAW